MLAEKLRFRREELMLRRSFCASDKDMERWETFRKGKYESFSEFIRVACDYFMESMQGKERDKNEA